MSSLQKESARRHRKVWLIFLSENNISKKSAAGQAAGYLWISSETCWITTRNYPQNEFIGARQQTSKTHEDASG